jgi:hypothetical protein
MKNVVTAMIFVSCFASSLVAMDQPHHLQMLKVTNPAAYQAALRESIGFSGGVKPPTTLASLTADDDDGDDWAASFDPALLGRALAVQVAALRGDSRPDGIVGALISKIEEFIRDRSTVVDVAAVEEGCVDASAATVDSSLGSILTNLRAEVSPDLAFLQSIVHQLREVLTSKEMVEIDKIMSRFAA